MLNKLKLMIQMQLTTQNLLIGPQWLEGEQDFMLAVGMETVEIIDHVGWKWWKHIPEADLAQVHLELVDIWHFILSHQVRMYDGNVEEAAMDILMTYNQFEDAGIDCITVLKKMAGLAFEGHLSVNIFIQACEQLGLDFETLYSTYIIKNTLVEFRDNYNYKGPDYIKVWDDKEDNVHLMEQAALLDVNDIDFRTNLYNAMVVIYPKG